MSSDRLDPNFSRLEVELFSDALETLSSSSDVAEVICQETRDEIKDTTLLVARRAIELGVLQNWQHHNVPFMDGHFEALISFEAHGGQEFDHLRLTTNTIKEFRTRMYSVESTDYRLRLFAGVLAVRRSTQIIKDGPTDQLDGSLPVIWNSAGGPMRRFTGRGYVLEPPASQDGMDYFALSQQLDTIRQLDVALSQFSREVTLEEEYPYNAKV